MLLREGVAITVRVGEESGTPWDMTAASPVLTARFRGLADVARVATVGSRHDLLRRVSVAAMHSLDGASVSLSIWDPEQRTFRCVLNDGQLSPGEVPEPIDEIYPIEDFPKLFPLVREQSGFICSIDQCDQTDPYVEYLGQLEKGSCLAAPIPLDGRVWGELFITRRVDQQAFVAHDIDFAIALAAQVGAAIATSEKLGEAEALAHIDALTGLANRRAIDEWFEVAMTDHREYGTDVGLVACDVNGLKQINDKHGHDAGDRVLRELADLLTVECAARLPHAMVARLGGDEFAVVAAGVSADELVALAEEVTAKAWRRLPHGIACGLACTGDAIGSIDTAGRLFRLADAAQYRAKRTQSQRPVVAGRVLPIEAASALAGSVSDAGDRRLRRGSADSDAVQLLDAALRALEQAADKPIGERLGLVADLVSHHVDAVGWWLSKVPPGSTHVETLEFAIYRALPGLTPQELSTELGMRFEISEFPSTQRALEGGGFSVRADDSGADAGELAILDDLAALAVVGAGGIDPTGVRWLVEVYTDELSGPERVLWTLLRVLVTVALNPPLRL
ncbi:MAG TPA: sensor domain-containing diguanylate cyclase [Actinomycetes bacterium]|nr:sensor domain-containing diguanylate cyclase [Actinomycetes bacterium]